MRRKFLRTGTTKLKRLGKGRKKKQKWRRAKGIDNKIREKRKGRARKVEIGYRKQKKERGKIRGKIPIIIRNLKESENIKKGDLVIIGKVGKKKRLKLEKEIEEKGGEILNKKRKVETEKNREEK